MQYFVCVYELIVGHPIEEIKLLNDIHVTVCKMLYKVTYQVRILQSGAAKQVSKFFLMHSLCNFYLIDHKIQITIKQDSYTKAIKMYILTWPLF